MSVLKLVSGAVVLLAVLVSGARAQDFSLGPAPAIAPAAHAMLEDGLPPARAGWRVETGMVRWFGLPELMSRSVALAGSWRAVRAAVGASQTGDPEIGWSAFAAAAGAAGPRGGAALRVVARRDRTASSLPGPLGTDIGLATGGGAWAEAAPGFVVWASAPQVWARGVAPPLARPLEIGARLEGGGLAAWIARATPVAGTTPAGGLRAGAAVALGGCDLWLEARDHPLRAGFGITARAGALRLDASVESHPVLDETVRLAVGMGAR